MSLGLFNCRLIQPAGDQLFFFAGCLASSGKLCSVSFVTHPARPRPAGGRSMLLVFPSQKGFVWVFQKGRSPPSGAGDSHRFSYEFPRRSPNPTHRFCYRAPFLLRSTPRGVCRARSRSRAHSVERWEASRDLRHDGVLSALGATVELAGNGANVPDQLGSGVSVGGMVCRVGLGAPETVRGRIHRGGRDSLGTRLAGRQLSDRHLPNRRALPALAVGGTPALASHATAGSEGTGAGGRKRATFCVQRHVEALLASHRGPGRGGFARAGSVPYHEPFESGGGSGAPRREHTSAGQKQESRPAAQAYALGITTPRQPGTRAGSAKAQCPAGQQTGHRTGLGFEGDLLLFLEVQIRDLGRWLSRLLVRPDHA